MTAPIHPTAVISPRAVLAEDVEVDAYSVIGEGVETLAQMMILDELGCDQIQGYVLARPRPVEELTSSLAYG